MHPPPTLDLPSDSVMLRRVRLHVGAAPGANGARMAEPVRRALAGADWPRPDGEAWVMLRAVSVRARTPIAIGPAVVRAVAARIAAAVDLDDPAAPGADAVRARDGDALLAHLARDLALGQAAARWYWRAWAALVALPTGAALAELLSNLLGGQPARLAAVTARLADLDALAPVWRALPTTAAGALLARLVDALGLQLPHGADAEVHADDGDRGAPTSDSPGGDAAGSTEVPPRLIARWRPALAGLDLADARVRLAVVLVTLEWRPLWLTSNTDRSSGARRLAAVAIALRGPTATGDRFVSGRRAGAALTSDPPPSAAPLFEPTAAPPSATAAAADAPPAPLIPRGMDHTPAPSGLSAVAVPPVAGPVPGSLAGLAVAGRGSPDAGGGDYGEGDDPACAQRAPDPDPYAAGTLIGAASPPLSVPRRPNLHRLRVRVAPITSAASVSQPPESQPPEPAAPRFASPPLAAPVPARYTVEGGLFYLVNFLARPEAQALLRTQDAGSRAGSGVSADVDGWAWLHGLGLRLGLDPNGALAAFLADQRGAPWPHDAGTDALLDRLADLGARLYGTNPVGADAGGADPVDGGLWRPDLLAVPALVDATPSHLDVRYPLGAVRLAVRRVALDVNPGWVPWLGRVLTFHYVEPWPGPPSPRPREPVPISAPG